MATISDQAIVIRRWDFSETSQTVSVLTRDHGIIRGLAKGAKRDKGAFSGGLDLLTEGEIVAIVKPERELATLTAWHLQRVHQVVRNNLAANRAAMFMAELVHRLLPDRDPHPVAFKALSDALASLDSDPARCEESLLRLQWAIVCEAGYRPQLTNAAGNSASAEQHRSTWLFDPHAGGLVRNDPTHEHLHSQQQQQPPRQPWKVRRETIEVLRSLDEQADARAPLLHAPPVLRRANRLLASYAREIIGSEPPAFRWAFPDLPVDNR